MSSEVVEIVEMMDFIKFLNYEMMWVYFVLLIVIFYGILALLTWNLKKPLLYLGIPSFAFGLLFLSFQLVINIFTKEISFLEKTGFHIFEPLFTVSVLSLIMGIIMIVTYIILKKMKNKKEKLVTQV